MNANSLRAILLVKNVEEQDAEGSILPLAEREAATRDALRLHPTDNGDPEAYAWRVLATRADSLRTRLADSSEAEQEGFKSRLKIIAMTAADEALQECAEQMLEELNQSGG